MTAQKKKRGDVIACFAVLSRAYLLYIIISSSYKHVKLYPCIAKFQIQKSRKWEWSCCYCCYCCTKKRDCIGFGDRGKNNNICQQRFVYNRNNNINHEK